jgi:outer membrane protein OmpA-like peptidoglycan-associated protein
MDNLYEFHKNDPVFTLTGTATHKSDKSPFEGVAIILIDETNEDAKLKQTIYTDKNGQYKFKLKMNSDYVVSNSKENYFTQSFILSTKGEKYSKNFVVDFELDEIIIEKPIVLNNIYYDFDKWNIRPDAAKELDKLVKLLNDNPTIHIEMGSHTDSRAGDRYNLILSEKRAKATVDYLVFRGINQTRLKYKGYGESMLVNRCKNNVHCSEEEHQENRRTEFKVIKINSNIGFSKK